MTTDRPRRRVLIDAPSEATILAARHLDATEGPVQIGVTVDTTTRNAIATVLRYIAKAHNSPAVEAPDTSASPIGEVQVTRELGRGVRVDHAPPRALIGLHIIRDLAWPANIAGTVAPDLVNIADQVLYRVTGYNPEQAALIVELVEDWRPAPTTAPSEEDTACTPIPAATLQQMTEAPPELRQAPTEAEQFAETIHTLQTTVNRVREAAAVDHAEQPAPVDWQAIAQQYERELKEAGEAQHRAEAERDRLRAGEEPGWDQRLVPTPGQWIASWNQASPAERLDVSARVIENAQKAGACFEQDHVRRLEEDRKAWVIVARIQDVIADMDNITGARHWARILRKAIDGGSPEPVDSARPAPDAVAGHPLTETQSADVDEAKRQMDADPYGLKAGMIVQPYRDRGESKWVFRCWGTDDGCDGLLSLDHHTQESAERARDRHTAEEHTKEQPMPDSKPACTATIEGPQTGSDTPVRCALDIHGEQQQHESAPQGSTKMRLHWTDHHAGATPHKEQP